MPALTEMTQVEVMPSIDECGRCLRRWSEHEVVTDHWGDTIRICPEEDFWDMDRELAWRRRQEEILP